MPVSITQATMDLREEDLPNMVLLEQDLPPPYQGFAAVREGRARQPHPRRTRVR